MSSPGHSGYYKTPNDTVDRAGPILRQYVKTVSKNQRVSVAACRLVLETLYRYVGPDGLARASYPELQDKTDLDERTVMRAAHVLSETGLAVAQERYSEPYAGRKGGRRLTTAYRLKFLAPTRLRSGENQPELPGMDGAEGCQGVTPTQPLGVTRSHPHPDKVSPLAERGGVTRSHPHPDKVSPLAINKERAEDSQGEDSKEDFQGDEGSTSARKKGARFTPPTVGEIRDLLRTFDPPRPDLADDIFDHYTSNGWRVGGKAPMKDWQASVRRWWREEQKRDRERLERKRSLSARPGRADYIQSVNDRVFGPKEPTE